MSKRYIDADALKEKKVYSVERHECVVPVAEIDWQPTADVVEVVRCRECNHCFTDDRTMYCERATGLDEILPDDFCSYGKRREPNQELEQEAIWKINAELLHSGGFGSMNGDKCFETLLRYWKAQEQAGYPHASESVKYFEDLVKKERGR